MINSFFSNAAVKKNRLAFLAGALGFLCACHSESPDSKSTAAGVASAEVTTSVPQASNQPSLETQQQFTAATGLSLPDAAKVLSYESVAGSDQLVKAVVGMTRADFTAWIATYYLDFSHFSEERRYLLGVNSGNWLPQAPSSLPTAQVRFENGKTLDIGYELLPNENVKVYLVFHGS